MRDKDPVIWLFRRSLSVRCDVRRGATSEEVQRSHPPQGSSPKRCRGGHLHQIHRSLSDSRASTTGSRALVSRLRGKAG